jgi:hypothetical protein
MGLPVCQSWDHGHHLCVARRRFRRAGGRTAAARPTRHAKCAPSAPRRPSPPCCTCGWSGPSFLQTSLSDRAAIGSSQPTQTPGCDGWRGLLRVHISRHRERRRRMAKPCCDHRDRTLCRCIDVPHVCQYPGAIGPTPTPSVLHLPSRWPSQQPWVRRWHTPPDNADHRKPRASKQENLRRPATTRPHPSNHEQRPRARSKLSEAKKRQLAHSAYRSVLFEYDTSHRQSATVPGRITATVPGRISYVHRDYR